jgi:exonuclease VII small subunit
MMNYYELVRTDYEIGIVKDGLNNAKESIKDVINDLEEASDFSKECGLLVEDFEKKLKTINTMLGELHTKAVAVEDAIVRLEKEGLVNV